MEGSVVSSAVINTDMSEYVQSHYNRLSLELSCYYWCWCSTLGDLIIPVDSLSTSLGMGVTITLNSCHPSLNSFKSGLGQRFN